MKTGKTVRRTLAIILAIILLALAVGYLVRKEVDPEIPAPSPVISWTERGETAGQGFLYGRITTYGGGIYEGRLRWGSGEEAFWGDYFNGFKAQNPWIIHIPAEMLRESRPLVILGIEIARRESRVNFGRPLMARFGDIARVEAQGREVKVTLKSGTVFDLDRLEASDFDDGVRVWDGQRGVVDLDSLWIGTIDFQVTPRLGSAEYRLHGTVRTQTDTFTGFVQWDRQECIGSDELRGHSAEGELSLRFDTIRSITRNSRDSALITLLDGRELVLSGTRKVASGNRGIYVDDLRYGRVLVSWDAFERVDFSPGGSGPAYDDFPPGHPLRGSVTTRAGRRLTGRLVYDLDESETTETLDAPSRGVDYTIPFGLISSILLPGPEEGNGQRALVSLHSGEELLLRQAGDLGERNGGMLVYINGGTSPEYVPWIDVEEIDFDQPEAMYPPLGER